jgi:hypothetical protein
VVGDMVQREFPELRNLIKVRRLPLGDRAEQTNVVFPESVSSTSPALHHASQAIRHQRAGAGTACDVSLTTRSPPSHRRCWEGVYPRAETPPTSRTRSPHLPTPFTPLPQTADRLWCGHSQGNSYCNPGGSNTKDSSYHYSNTNGSYYYQNDNGAAREDV